MHADRILVIRDGEIIEEGSHNELIRARGKYHDLWLKQALVKTGGEPSELEGLYVEDDTLGRSLDAKKSVLAQSEGTSETTHSRQTRNQTRVLSAEGNKPEHSSINKREVGDTPGRAYH
jgi:ABC-type multidrug transport system ATPase subunit